MSRADEIWAQLESRGSEFVNELIANMASEELYLDFKRSTDENADRRLHDDDRKNLGKAISGFGNSDGGVIIWGGGLPP